MAEVSINFILKNLSDLLVYNPDLIFGMRYEVESLQEKLRLMQAFLYDSIEKINDYETAKEVVRAIRDAAYETEDMIDTLVVWAFARSRRRRSVACRFFHLLLNIEKSLLFRQQLLHISKRIDSISTMRQSYTFFNIEVDKVRESWNTTSTSSKTSSYRRPIVEEDNVVGFDQQVKMLVNRLSEGTDELQVISIVGMGGIGKTTLATKVFNHSTVQDHFSIRSWVNVSQVYDRREVFLAILSSITSLFSEEMYVMKEEKLAEQVYKHLKGRRYLIVMDDVWTTQVWDDFKKSFPHDNNGSKIILTSRNKDVALFANPDGVCDVSFLTWEESWELLSKKVFGKGSCQPELEEIGKEIAKKCEGLPLAIVVVAGHLLMKDKRLHWWKKVAENVSSYVSGDTEKFMDTLALSYINLPHHLKLCFIYFGLFPKDFEIPVWKLLRLWVAEGFINQRGQGSLEDIAEELLEDLIHKNLVIVVKKKTNDRVKTCRIHGLLRDLCLAEAAKQNILQEIAADGAPMLTYYRRLSIHGDHVLNYIGSKPSCPHARSFLCFYKGEMDLPREHTSFFFKAFNLLRVLDISSICLSHFPREMRQLVQLRYVSLFGKFELVPASISKLWNLQTLIVLTTFRSIDIQANIWKMLQFRHLYTNVSCVLHGPPAKTLMGDKNPLAMRDIQTFSSISPASCTESVLDRSPNLKKLGIRGKLIELVEENGGSSLFDNIAKLYHLETLKLLNDTIPLTPSEGKLPGLPRWYNFPPNLKKLTLSETMLDWEHMSVLGQLPHLEVLKLKDYAFMGHTWEMPLNGGGFPVLRVLHLGKTDLVHWKASGHHFPRLEHIVLRHCTSLEAIPSGLGDADRLQTMELYSPTSSAATSARLIQEKREVENGLKLVIDRPDL